MKTPFRYNDGGRSQYYEGKEAGDCVTRAIAIAFEMDYKEVYDRLSELVKKHTKSTRGTARDGVPNKATKELIEELGGEWTATMGIGTGCTVHVRADELPSRGRYILNLSKHVAAWVDGELHDSYDCSRGGTRCVYGYWKVPEQLSETEKSWNDGFNCALQILILCNDHETAKMLIDESNIDVSEFIEAQRRSATFDDQMAAFFSHYFDKELHPVEVIEFTPIEWEIIEHRLEAPDALSDALEEDGYSVGEVFGACQKLIDSEGRIDWHLTDCARAVLKDACDGSVFMACANGAACSNPEPKYGEISMQKLAAYNSACDRIEAKLEKLDVTIPRQ